MVATAGSKAWERVSASAKVEGAFGLVVVVAIVHYVVTEMVSPMEIGLA